MKKKGNLIVDFLIVVVFVFIIGVAWLAGHYIQKELNTEIQASPDISADGKALNAEVTAKYPQIFDKAIIFFLIAFWGMALVASALNDTHPAFFWFSIILLILCLTVVVVLANVFNEIFSEDLTGLDTDFPLTFWLFNHFLEVCIVIGITILLALFAKPK